jgi:hypothetical protein
MKKATKKVEQYAILANKSYGLYAGIVESIDKNDSDSTLTVKVKDCRHVARWYGKTGGITSLAAYGLCGQNAAQSRIGAPVSATLTGIVNIFNCTPEARKSIEAATQQ